MCVFRLNHLAAEGTHCGKRDPVKGTGFSPYISWPGINWALAPEGMFVPKTDLFRAFLKPRSFKTESLYRSPRHGLRWERVRQIYRRSKGRLL